MWWAAPCWWLRVGGVAGKAWSCGLCALTEVQSWPCVVTCLCVNIHVLIFLGRILDRSLWLAFLLSCGNWKYLDFVTDYVQFLFVNSRTFFWTPHLIILVAFWCIATWTIVWSLQIKGSGWGWNLWGHRWFFSDQYSHFLVEPLEEGVENLLHGKLSLPYLK